MQISASKENGTLIVAAQGRLDSNTSDEFGTALLNQINDGEHKLIVDFRKLDYISSAGLRSLLMAAKNLKKANGSFAICCVEKHIREVFEISGFLKLLNVCGSIENAQAKMK